MNLFPVLKFEPVIQVNDKTRFDASKSYSSGGADPIDLFEIDVGTGWLDISSSQFLDWQFENDGSQLIKLRVSNDDLTVEAEATITVISKEDDNLFSEDYMLEVYEPEIFRYLRAGRVSYLDAHRRVQGLILDWLDANRFWRNDGTRYASSDLVDIKDFKEWSCYWVLQIIFEGLSDKVDDKFSSKSRHYSKLADSARDRGTFRLDRDKNGTIESWEKTDLVSKGIVRR